MKHFVLTLFVVFVVVWTSLDSVYGQYKMSNKEYVSKYAPIAIRKMSEYKIPASITLAQGILESGSGSSRLTVEGNNHFGIKCGSRWTGERIYHDDDSRGECFRKYRSAEESYNDHSLFLTQNQRYAGLFTLDILDYKGWARGLKAAGYATNPQYPVLLIKLIEDNELWKLDQQGAVETKRKPDGLVGWIAERNNKQSDNGAGGVTMGPIVVEKINGVRYVVAQAGDSFESISQKTGVSVKKLLQFNDLYHTTELSEGVAVYIQRKKNKSRGEYMCQVSAGETMHVISQRYGIQIKALYKLNPSYRYKQPTTGTYLRLR